MIELCAGEPSECGGGGVFSNLPAVGLSCGDKGELVTSRPFNGIHKRVCTMLPDTALRHSWRAHSGKIYTV